MSTEKKFLNVGIVGCGFVSAYYMRTASLYKNLKFVGATDLIKERAEKFSTHYKIPLFESVDAMMADKNIDVILNLTNPHSHYEIAKKALSNGKHVYCEKPLATDVDEAKELKVLADVHNLLLSSAPCSYLSSTAQTLKESIKNKKIGDIKLVYAEMDDGPVHLMNPENWKNELGVPWPIEEEFETGCTLEHIAYTLSWLLQIFGPAVHVTAFSHCLMPKKMEFIKEIHTPDFSVACIQHENGVITRLTCGILAPVDRSLTIIGEKGILRVDDTWDNQAPVRMNLYTSLKLKAERKEWIANNWLLRKVFNLNYKDVPLINPAKKPIKLIPEKIRMDYLLGVSDLAEAALSGKKPVLDSTFSLHVTELSLKIQEAQQTGQKIDITTKF